MTLKLSKFRTTLFFLTAYAALLLLHLTLLDLPYYWDEAGYFIPAARDIYADGAFIPHSTLSNAHPPLVMTWIALSWKLFGFKVWVARAAMACVAAFALTGVYALGRRVANGRVGIASAVCIALYPVFFAQTTLAHLDMMVAALTLWALYFYLPPRDATPSPLRVDTGKLHDKTTELCVHTPEVYVHTPELRVHTPEVCVHTPEVCDNTTQVCDDAPELRVHTSELRDHTGDLYGETEALRSDTTPLRGGTTPLQGEAETLRRPAISLHSGRESWRILGNVQFRRGICVFLLALAALAKETAVLVPVVLCGWELLCWLLGEKKYASFVCLERRPAWRSLALLLACVPLALWFAYHRAQTGYMLGNPEYFRYNVESTLNLARVLDTIWRRLGHVTAHMNLWALTLLGLLAMFLKPRRDGHTERTRISVPVQLLFLALILAHVVALSVVGGAVLARYMLPVLPLVVLIWVSTLWRRVPAWPLAVALVCAAFVYRTEVNPTYSFPWEENLAYRDFILLHRDAAHFLAEKHAGARVLTSWPATDELRNPYYGYTPRAFNVVPVENFLPPELQRAAARKDEYDLALLYSSHGGPELEDAARLLGGHVLFHAERKGQWVAVVGK